MGPLIQPQDLANLIAEAKRKILVCDCSFDLTQPTAGRAAYDAGHIPGAAHVHLDEDLSGEKTGRNGRHPLPDAVAFTERMRELGADDDTLIVAYDRSGGMFAARLWWLLGWVGHQNRKVLDGGFPAWQEAGLVIETVTPESRAAGNFSRRPSLVKLVDRQFVLNNLQTREKTVLDARSADRYRGENETLDAKAGHIPGARNRFFQLNLAGSRFKSANQLREEFDDLLGGLPPGDIVHQCGSGVTACHNLLAMEVAGLGGGALYAGSWSEWSQHEGAPIATGEHPDGADTDRSGA